MRAFRLGLIPHGGDRDEPEREFVAALASALTRAVQVHRAADYSVVVAGLEQGLVDFAWLPPLPAARATSRRLADPVAVAVRYGETTYRTALIARADSPIRSPAELRGARAAWVDRESAGGYVVLRAALARAGVSLTEAFARESFVRSHAAVARAVLAGEVDVGATCIHQDAAGTARIARSPHAQGEALAEAGLRVVFEAGPIPSDLFAVRCGVAATVRSAVETGLLEGHPERVRAAARALMHADGFAAPTGDHRRMLERLIAP
jgi:phosphonate transport system substrate-binding protein